MRLGEHRISTDIDCDDLYDSESCKKENFIQDIEISKMIPHEQFGPMGSGSDIALLVLKKNAILKIGSVHTICLPLFSTQNIDNIKQDMRGTNPTMIISGWGKPETATSSDVLLQGKVSYLDSADCEQRYHKYQKSLKSHFRIRDDQMVC